MTQPIRSRAYLASPLFNPREREFNIELADRLGCHVDVFVPQRDGKLLTKLVAEGKSVTACQELIYEKDTKAIEEADIIVAVLDGRTIDEGVAFEIGYGRALGKTCFSLKSDDRSMLPTGDNPMIVCACHYRASTVEELIMQIKSWLLAHRLSDSSTNQRFAALPKATGYLEKER